MFIFKFLILILLFLLLVGFTVVGRFLSALFGGTGISGRSRRTRNGTNRRTQNKYKEGDTVVDSDMSKTSKKKVISKDDGEYVDYIEEND